MSFSRFAQTAFPLSFTPSLAPKSKTISNSSTEPWNKLHRWNWGGGHNWTVYPEREWTEEDGPVDRGHCYYGYAINTTGYRISGAFRVQELELIENQ